MPGLPGWEWAWLSMSINRADQALAEGAGWAQKSLLKFNYLYRSLIECFMVA